MVFPAVADLESDEHGDTRGHGDMVPGGQGCGVFCHGDRGLVFVGEENGRDGNADKSITKDKIIRHQH